MSDNVSENVELGHLPQQPQECCEEDHQEGELDEDDEEGKEEEKMSLLGEEDSLSCPPVQIVIADRHRSGEDRQNNIHCSNLSAGHTMGENCTK